MAGKIRTLGPGIFKITDTENGRDFSADLTKAQLNPIEQQRRPDHLPRRIRGGRTPRQHGRSRGTVGDDFSEDGLAVWLFDHKGRDAAGPVRPRTIPAKIQWTFNVTIAPIAIGGDVKSKNTNDLSFAVTNVAHAPYTGK